MPGGGALEVIGGSIDVPPVAHLPAEALANGRQQARHSTIDVPFFRENLADFVLQPQPLLRLHPSGEVGLGASPGHAQRPGQPT